MILLRKLIVSKALAYSTRDAFGYAWRAVGGGGVSRLSCDVPYHAMKAPVRDNRVTPLWPQTREFGAPSLVA